MHFFIFLRRCAKNAPETFFRWIIATSFCRTAKYSSLKPVHKSTKNYGTRDTTYSKAPLQVDASCFDSRITRVWRQLQNKTYRITIRLKNLSSPLHSVQYCWIFVNSCEIMGKKPGEMALEALKKMNDKVSVFKIPSAPQVKKTRMKILTEEKYIEVGSPSFPKVFQHLNFYI